MSEQTEQQTDASSLEADRQKELRVLSEVVASLQTLSDVSLRTRVIQAAAAFFGIHLAQRSAPVVQDWGEEARGRGISGRVSFSEDRTISPKDFLLQKQPRTEVERVACLAYYLTHYRETLYFKTIDISKLNTEAAQPKFGNAAQAIDNATKTHYLAAASRGNKQLSAPGELFVQALPDREAARLAMSNAKPRRRKKIGQSSESEDNGGE